MPPGSGDAELLYAIEHLVLPVLRDFQPDLVINAAGQDNHFSDPLTNMQVTAEGYARLTELLAPDIVVLEGGYSVEGALPYVNAGIILALAGLDYSGVIEPELGTGASKNRPVREEVVRDVAYLQSVWNRRKEQDLDKIFGEKDYFFRQRYIYYDTDNITEYQAEAIKRCSACSGYRRVYSQAEHPSGRVRARTRVKIGAVLLPWHACRSCRQAAEEACEQMKAEEELGPCLPQDPEND